MNRYLIFRTDRIGDFLVSAILIKSIKKNDKISFISVVASEKNYDYIKTFKFVDEVILLKNNFLDKIKLIFRLKALNYHYIILHDNKKRSHFVSYFLNSKKKILITKFLHLSQIEIVKKILYICNFNFNQTDLDILDEKKINNFEQKNFILFHFDEKWIHKSYIKNYINIEPFKNELLLFLKSIILQTQKKIIITTGVAPPKVLDEIFSYNSYENILYVKNLDFLSLEKITINSDLLISCHGSISHLASAKKIRQIDIIDKSYNYSRWTEHFRNYSFIYRDSFINLSKKILEELSVIRTF